MLVEADSFVSHNTIFFVLLVCTICFTVVQHIIWLFVWFNTLCLH